MTKTTQLTPKSEKPVESGGLFAKIRQGREGGPRRVCLYGGPGIGKTTWASTAPSPILLPTEHGFRDVDIDHFPLLESYGEFKEALVDATTKDHSYKTLVIDSLDWLEKLVWRDVCESQRVESIDTIGYGKGYGLAMARWEHLMKGLNHAVNKRGMHVLILAHSDCVKYTPPDSSSYDRYQPRLHKTAGATVIEWCDEVLFATEEVQLRSHDEGYNATRNQAISTSGRIIYTGGNPACVAKNRLSMPRTIPMPEVGGWDEYAKHHKGA